MRRIVVAVWLLIAGFAVPASAYAWDIDAAQQYAHDYWSPANENLPHIVGKVIW